MSIVPNDEDRAYARGVKQGYAAATEMRWREYPGSTPSRAGDGRALVWIEVGDGMAYIGLRHYRVCSDGDGWGWYTGSTEESGHVTHWMPLPQPSMARSPVHVVGVDEANRPQCASSTKPH